jgi:hypothetical protein
MYFKIYIINNHQQQPSTSYAQWHGTVLCQRLRGLPEFILILVGNGEFGMRFLRGISRNFPVPECVE